MNKMNRREFLKLVGVSSLAVAGGLLLGFNFENVMKFLEEERKRNGPIDVTVRELNDFPENYVNKKIRVDGYPEYVGDEPYFVALPYYNPLLGTVMLSISEVRTTTYKLHELPTIDSAWIRMTKTDGPLYLPISFVPAPRKVYKNHLRATGTWTKDEKNKDKYFLNVSSIEELK
jgi:hypothetical protein